MAYLLLATALIGQITMATPSEAVGWAIAHQVETPEADRPLYRYIWIPEWMVKASEPHPDGDRLPKESKRDERHIAAVVSYAINEAASQTGLIVTPRPIANGFMLAVYLPNYASATKKSQNGSGKSELQVLVDTWDGLAQNEPYFHETRANVGEQKISVVATHLTLGEDGQPIKDSPATVLSQMQKSPAIVYRADWFLKKIWEDNYYDFAQFGKNQLDVYAAVGVNEQLARNLSADQRSIISVSGVTGKPRRVDQFQGVVGTVWQTWDNATNQDRVEQNPLYNLLKFEPAGGEAIFQKPNGLHGYIIYNAHRDLIRVADGVNLVADSRIPAAPNGPGTFNLVPGISCVRCHADSDGLKPVPNHLQNLLDAGIDVLDDFDGDNRHEVVQELAALYAGDFAERLRLGRDMYDRAVRRATSVPGLPAGLGAAEAGDLTSGIFVEYVYPMVDVSQACRELGAVPDSTDPVKTFNELVPPLTPENVIVGLLRANIPVARRDWEQVYSSVRLRSLQNQLAKEKE